MTQPEPPQDSWKVTLAQAFGLALILAVCIAGCLLSR